MRAPARVLRTSSALTRRLAMIALLVGLLIPSLATAAPEAHILRIDPRTSQASGDPILTTLIELVQPKRVSTVIAPCATMAGSAQYDCMSSALEKPGSLYTPYNFPASKAIFTVEVDEGVQPASFVSQATWGRASRSPESARPG